MYYHENAFVLQFWFGDHDRVLVSVSADAGRELFQFIERARELSTTQMDDRPGDPSGSSDPET